MAGSTTSRVPTSDELITFEEWARSPHVSNAHIPVGSVVVCDIVLAKPAEDACLQIAERGQHPIWDADEGGVRFRTMEELFPDANSVRVLEGGRDF